MGTYYSKDLERRHQDIHFLLNVIDLGLRLDDVEVEGLTSEEVSYRESKLTVARNLRESGASEEEIKFLLTQRVELNAFTADGLVAWIERKLKEHGVKKVVPDEEMLIEAYRRERQSVYLESKFAKLLKKSEEFAKEVEVPDDLETMVRIALDDHPELPWNEAVGLIARK